MAHPELRTNRPLAAKLAMLPRCMHLAAARSCATVRGEWELDAADAALCVRAAELLLCVRDMRALLLTAPDSLDAAACAAHISAVLDAFRGDPCLESARLRGGAAAVLAPLLPPGLQALALESARVDVRVIACLRSALATQTGLRRLELRFCALGRDGASALTPALMRLRHLTALELEGLPPASVSLLATALPALTALRRLVVHDDGNDEREADDRDSDDMWFSNDVAAQEVCAHVPALAALTELDMRMSEHLRSTQECYAAACVLREAVALPALARLRLRWLNAHPPDDVNANFAAHLSALRMRVPALDVAITLAGSGAVLRSRQHASDVAALAEFAPSVEGLQGGVRAAWCFPLHGATFDELFLVHRQWQQEWAGLVDTFASMRKLTSLRLHSGRWLGGGMASNGCDWRAALAPFTALQRLAFDDFGDLEEPVICALARSLPQLTSLQHLDLHAWLADNAPGIAAATAALPLPSALRSLSLRGFAWPDAAVRMLGRSLARLPTLSRLCFVSARAADVAAVAPHLPALRALRSLDLRAVGGRAQQATPADIGAHIAGLTQLTGLVLGWTFPEESSPAQRCAEFGAAVGPLSYLQSLDVRGDVPASAALAIAPVLLRMSHLTAMLFDGEELAALCRANLELDWLGVRLPPRVPVNHIVFAHDDAEAALQRLAVGRTRR
jgi:hypothetical protein